MDTFYRRTGTHTFEPTDAAIGPWAPDLLHGGPPIALLAHAMDAHAPQPDMGLARLSVEFLGAVPLAPCEIDVAVTRPGRRISLLEARMRAGGRDVMLARAWRMQREADCAQAAPDDFATPTLPEAGAQVALFPGVGTFPYAEAMEWRFSRGSFDTLGPATVWARPRIGLVRDEATTGLDRLLLMLDSANGVSAELPLRDWTFVPVDLQLSLHRPIADDSDWTGMDARSVIDPSGVGTTHATVFDRGGACGRSLHTLFVRPR